MKGVINLLAKIPAFRKAVLLYAFNVQYGDSKEEVKLDYRFTTSSGKKYYTYIKPDFIPIARWNEIETRLMEMNSRVNRETLSEFSKTTKVAAERGELLTVARLMGELEERIDMLYDPHALIRIISALYIREDQIESAGVWNDRIEDSKFDDIKKDLESGSLLFFSISEDLRNVLTFSDTSTGDYEIFEKRLLNNQIKQTEAFDQMLKKIKTAISK